MDAEVREERFADTMLLSLKVEGGYYLKNEESGKGKRTDFPLEIPERTYERAVFFNMFLMFDL